jgi:hypothetical protein
VKFLVGLLRFDGGLSIAHPAQNVETNSDRSLVLAVRSSAHARTSNLPAGRVTSQLVINTRAAPVYPFAAQLSRMARYQNSSDELILPNLDQDIRSFTIRPQKNCENVSRFILRASMQR